MNISQEKIDKLNAVVTINIKPEDLAAKLTLHNNACRPYRPRANTRQTANTKSQYDRCEAVSGKDS